MFKFLGRLFGRKPPPHYVIIIEQSQEGLSARIVGPGIPIPVLKGMLLATLQRVEQQEALQAAQRGGK